MDRSFRLAAGAAVCVLALPSPGGFGQNFWAEGVAPLATYTSAIATPGPFAGMTFDPTGSTLYLGSGGNSTTATVVAFPAVRSASTGKIAGFGPPATVAAAPGIDGGLQWWNGTLFFTAWPSNLLGQFNGSTTATYNLPASTQSPGGLAFVPQGLPNAGTLLVSSYDTGMIWTVQLSPAGNGFYSPVGATPFAQLPAGMEGIQFIPSGPRAGDLLFVNYDTGDMGVLALDPSGNPVGGVNTPQITYLAGGLVWPDGLAIDPLAGDVFASLWSVPDSVLQIGGVNTLTPLAADAGAAVASSGTLVTLRLRAGSARAGRAYLLAASASGASPGIPLGSTIVPLNYDIITQFVIDNINTPMFPGFLGTLDANGSAAGTLTLPPLAVASPFPLHFAYLLLNPADYASNAEPFVLLP